MGCVQATVDADVTRYVETIDVNFYYLPYEVKVAAFNSLGHGPNSSVEIIMSQEDRKSNESIVY
jgi:hypothetical protein